MRIALVTIGRFLESKGGAEKVLCNMANEFVKRGHEVGVFCCDKKTGKPAYELSENVLLQNVYQASLRMKWLSLCREFCCLSYVDEDRKKIIRAKKNIEIKSPLLLKAIAKYVPDVIVTFQMESTRMLDSPEIGNTPIVTMLHGNPSIYFDSKTFPLYKASLEKSSFVQVLMPEYIEEAKQYIDTEIKYIPNVVPQYAECAALNAKKIINVGRLCPHSKRQDLLIQAFSLIKEQYKDWIVEIWGEGDEKYKKKLEHLIEEENLSGRVVLCGVTDKIKEKMLEASIFAFPSAYEGFPLALTEAMSLGLPSVGFRNCSSVNSLIVDGENGYLVKDINEFSRALMLLMENYEMRKNMGNKAREKIKKFSPAEVWNHWEKELIVCKE